MKLLLFDIDGTLLLSGGAGKRAMNRAFAQLYGFDEILDGISLSGRTDNTIMKDAYVRANVDFSDEELQRFKTLYFELIKEEMQQDAPDKRLMPGVDTLLPMLAEREDVHMGLLTGNWETSGRTKINFFGLNSYFPFGAFSDDSAIRDELVPVALQRFRTSTQMEIDPRDVYVIGDTPADIQCAKPHGVVSVAVAAASHSADVLQPFEPDVLLNDLSDTEAMLNLLG